MSYVRSAIVAVAVSSLPVWASAAPIDINAAGYELAVGSDTTMTLTGDGLGFDGASLGAGIFFAVDAATFSSLSSFDVMSAADYALAFDGDGDFIYEASASFGATEVSLMDGVIEVLFESFTGAGVYAGVDALLVTYSNANLTNAANAYAGFFADAQGDTSTLRVQGLNDIAPIPLPAGLPLMIGGLACFAWMRRSKKA